MLAPDPALGVSGGLELVRVVSASEPGGRGNPFSSCGARVPACLAAARGVMREKRVSGNGRAYTTMIAVAARSVSREAQCFRVLCRFARVPDLSMSMLIGSHGGEVLSSIIITIVIIYFILLKYDRKAL